MAPEDRPPGFEDFDARLRRLRGEEEAGKPPAARAQWSSYSAGWQAGIEILGGVIGGGLIGYGLDYWLGTAPWLLIVFFILGAAGGLRNAYRRLSRLGGDGGEADGRPAP